jgi:hypothetical protein
MRNPDMERFGKFTPQNPMAKFYVFPGPTVSSGLTKPTESDDMKLTHDLVLNRLAQNEDSKESPADQ